MKKLLIIITIAFISNSLFSQEEIIDLPTPERDGGKPLMEAINERQSAREFANKTMPEQTLSNLLWAAYGINREEAGKHTIPTSRNVQDIDVYITTQDGAFLYLPEKNALKKIVDSDIRASMGKQEFTANAALNLVYVSDFSKYEGGDENTKHITASAHCGFIGQNVYLYCASEGLNSVFRAWIDKDLIHQKLKLDDSHHVIYTQTVGYPK
jgi:SagB-type dehydrogenase family enzyme